MVHEAPAYPCLLAFYGSLMRGLGGLETLGVTERVRYLGRCEIAGRLFDLGEYPGLVRATGRVQGELFEVGDARTLAALDRFEGFDRADVANSYYLREEVRLLSPDRTAMVYVYNREVGGLSPVASGDWRAYLALRAG